MPLDRETAETELAATSKTQPGPIGYFALKHADTFLVADALGDVWGTSDGMFSNDTRVLSRFVLTIGGAPPSLLGSWVSQDNVFFRGNMTNRPLPQLGGAATPQGVIHLERARFLWRDRLYERIVLTNYNESDLNASLSLAFNADFIDIFEVRGYVRRERGRLLPPQVGGQRVLLHYEGLDNVVRESAISFSHPPLALSAGRADFAARLGRHDCLAVYIEVGKPDPALPDAARFRAAAIQARSSMRIRRRHGAALRTSTRAFNVWIEKSRADIALLTTELPTGPYPYAGIPWFSTPFGRDGILTALEMLWVDPPLARGVLSYLAANQAHESSSFADSAPGKIMHETRRGEVNALHELPFGRYYGGVDTTPLFVMLAGAYAVRTGDAQFIDSLWPSLLAAMAWIEGAGDSNGDGFVDYARGESTGLANQGWKDSSDSVFHADGRMPQGPIALVEVQGYVYSATRAMAALALQRGDRASAERWRERAEKLRLGVEARFWVPKLGFYGIALDGSGAVCAIRASNAGQLLYSGLPSRKRAALVTEQLLAPPFNSGWGVRTLADTEARFNPMSYHNGSMWPHDAAICAAGMARYGDRRGVSRLLNEISHAAGHFGMRLPELFCGFRRIAGEPPVGYPVACLPQAWSSGAVFMLLQACLGLRVDAWRRTVAIDRPELPVDIERMTIHGLEVAGERIDLLFQRVGERITVSPLGTVPDSIRIAVTV